MCASLTHQTHSKAPPAEMILMINIISAGGAFIVLFCCEPNADINSQETDHSLQKTTTNNNKPSKSHQNENYIVF